MTLHTPPLFELQVKSTALGEVSGHASVFGGIDGYGDRIAPGAYKATIAKHREAGTAPVMLWSHQKSVPIGRWTTLAEDDRGLYVEGKLNLKTPAGSAAFEHVAHGDISGLSIGYGVPAGGAEHRPGFRLLKQIDLYEVSFVTFPADASARIASVKDASTGVPPTTIRGLEEALQTIGYTRREARRIATKGFFQAASGAADHSQSELVLAGQAVRDLLTTFKGSTP